MNSPHHKIIATKSLIASLMLLCVLSCSAEEHIRFFRRSAGMVSIDTRSNKMRSCNSVPFWHDYIEVFLCKDKNDALAVLCSLEIMIILISSCSICGAG